MTELAVVLLVALAFVPLTMLGARLAKRHRRTAFAAASFLLLFGLGANVTPPPPPRMEQEAREEDEAEKDEPKA